MRMKERRTNERKQEREKKFKRRDSKSKENKTKGRGASGVRGGDAFCHQDSESDLSLAGPHLALVFEKVSILSGSHISPSAK